MLLTKNVFRHPFGSNESSCIGHANKELALFFSTLFIEDKSDVVAVVQPEPTPASPRWRMAITLFSETRSNDPIRQNFVAGGTKAHRPSSMNGSLMPL
jgi:hypothetical protein